MLPLPSFSTWTVRTRFRLSLGCVAMVALNCLGCAVGKPAPRLEARGASHAESPLPEGQRAESDRLAEPTAKGENAWTHAMPAEHPSLSGDWSSRGDSPNEPTGVRQVSGTEEEHFAAAVKPKVTPVLQAGAPEAGDALQPLDESARRGNDERLPDYQATPDTAKNEELQSDLSGRPEEIQPARESLPELTLDAAIAAGLRNDPVLRAGFEEIAQANAEWVTSSLKPNPELEILQTLLPLTAPFEADVREGGPPQLDIMFAYPIDWFLFGKRAAAMRSAAEEVRVSQSEYADLIRLRVLEASLAYYDVMEAQALVDLAEQDAANLMEVERATEIAVDNDALPRVELSRIRLDRLNSQQTLREALRDLRIAKAELRGVIGGEIPGVGLPDGDFRVSDQLESQLGQDPSQASEILIEEAFLAAQANRPDIQALNLRISQGRAEMESQRREGFAEITPMVGYTRQFQRRAIGFPDADSWGAGVAMTLPVNDRNQGNRLLAAAQWRQSNHELQAGLVELRAEVAQVAAELETARYNAAAIAEEQLRLAEEVRDSILQAYEAGGRPLIDVLDSQRNFRETYGNYIASRADYLRAIQRFNATLNRQFIP